MGHHSESEIQVAFMGWLKESYPAVNLVTFHVPNGGYRTAWAGKQLKKEGVKPGVPDIFMAVPSSSYHGLFIEFKYGYNKASEAQLAMMANLSKQGYICRVCYSLEAAQRIVENYLRIGVSHV